MCYVLQSNACIALTQCSPSVGYVAHPQGSAADVRKAVGIIGRFSNGAYLTAVSDKDRDLEVSYHIMILTLEVSYSGTPLKWTSLGPNILSFSKVTLLRD